MQDAFDRWLAKGRPAYMEKERLGPPMPAIAWPSSPGRSRCWPIHCPWACHPAELESAVGELAEAGLVGLEAIYGRYSQEERASLAVMAARAGLAITGGSDHHGTYKPDLTVGTGRGDLHVPDSALEALKDRLPVTGAAPLKPTVDAAPTAARVARPTVLVQAAKTAVAAGLAWFLAADIIGNNLPVFAPLAAVLTVQVTVWDSVSAGPATGARGVLSASSSPTLGPVARHTCVVGSPGRLRLMAGRQALRLGAAGRGPGPG